MSNFTVIIPVYNEEELIVENTGKLIKCLQKISENFEIIIVDNGSTDKTVKLGKKIEKKYPEKFKILSIPEKGYVGFAFREGVKNSKYDKIISLDMDLSIELDFVPRCLELLENNSIVIGSKKVGEQQRQWYRVFASNIFIWLTKTILDLEYEDYSMAAKGFRKKDIEKYLEHIDKGSAYVYELTYWVEKEGKKITQIPTICNDTRKSKFKIIDESLYRFRNLITLWLFKKV
jgi:glycosyltransferase involved in cell wall biosynthesis